MLLFDQFMFGNSEVTLIIPLKFIYEICDFSYLEESFKLKEK